MADAPKTKLRTKAYGPFKVLAATPNTVVIEFEDGVPETVSIDRVTLAPKPRPPTPGPDPHPPVRRNFRPVVRQADELPVPTPDAREETERTDDDDSCDDTDPGEVPQASPPPRSTSVEDSDRSNTDAAPTDTAQANPSPAPVAPANFTARNISIATPSTLPSVAGPKPPERPISIDPGLITHDSDTTFQRNSGPVIEGRNKVPPLLTRGTGPARGTTARSDPLVTSSRHRLPRSRQPGTSTATEGDLAQSPSQRPQVIPDGKTPPASQTPLPDRSATRARSPASTKGPSARMTSKEFVVDHIVGHEKQPDGTYLYHVRWFQFPPDADTLEPAEHLPAAMRARYWNKFRADASKTATPARRSSRRRSRK